MTSGSLLYKPDGAFRAPWRLAVFVAATLMAWLLLDGIAASPLTAAAERVGLENSVSPLVGAAALIMGHVVALRVVDRRPWSDVWLGRDAARVGAWSEGWLIGALAIGVPCAALLAAHELRVISDPPGQWLGAAGRVSLMLAAAALLEELLTRGYVFRVLCDTWGPTGALAVTSAAFGLLHLANPGVQAQSVLAVVLAGIFLGTVVLATRSLYAAWMAHFAWNWVMAVAMHSAVSGIPLEAPNYQVIDAGPAWLTGGAWGPEGGAAAAAGMVVGLTYLYARRMRREES